MVFRSKPADPWTRTISTSPAGTETRCLIAVRARTASPLTPTVCTAPTSCVSARRMVRRLFIQRRSVRWTRLAPSESCFRSVRRRLRLDAPCPSCPPWAVHGRDVLPLPRISELRHHAGHPTGPAPFLESHREYDVGIQYSGTPDVLRRENTQPLEGGASKCLVVTGIPKATLHPLAFYTAELTSPRPRSTVLEQRLIANQYGSSR